MIDSKFKTCDHSGVKVPKTPDEILRDAAPEMLEALIYIRDKGTALPAVLRAIAEKAIQKAEGK